jgi:hypothetical protein
MKTLKLQQVTSYFGYILLAVVLFSSCSNKNDGYFKHDRINTIFYVNDTYKAKYSKVKGYIIYSGIKVPIDNGNDGYHYKDYSLKVGDKIEAKIDIYYYSTNYGYELVFGDVDVSRYVLNNR